MLDILICISIKIKVKYDKVDLMVAPTNYVLKLYVKIDFNILQYKQNICSPQKYLLFFQETFPHQGHSPEPGGPEAALRVRDEPRPDDLHSRPAQAHPPGALLPLDWSGVGIPHLDLCLPFGKHWCEKYLLSSLNLFFTFQD